MNGQTIIWETVSYQTMPYKRIWKEYKHNVKNIVLGNNIIPSWPSHER